MKRQAQNIEVLCIGNAKVTSHRIIQWSFSIIVQGTQCTICLVPVPWLPSVKCVRLCGRKMKKFPTREKRKYIQRNCVLLNMSITSLGSHRVDYRPQCTDVPGHCHISCVLTECITFVWVQKFKRGSWAVDGYKVEHLLVYMCDPRKTAPASQHAIRHDVTSHSV